MAIFKCKMCGGTIEFQDGATVGVCDSCGTKQTLPRLDSDRKTNLYDRANHFRRNNEFDKAMSIYENILNEDPTDAEAYWSLVLCRYGIEYVEDPATHRRVPTVNRAQFTSIFDDEDYKSALKNADALQRTVYEDEAKAINEIQKGILEISAKEEPFDVFICYKDTDANGRRTPDSVLATDLYHQLTNEGFKVFFSRITLEDKLGQEYEPYIFAALNSAKAMVVLGTKPEHFNAVWVKNEWSRYLALIKAGAKKTLIPAYRDMDPYDLPDEFSHLQAQDMSKLGFMQDLIRGIKKIVRTDEPKQTTIRETVVQQPTQTNTAPLLRRAFMFLEDGEWNSANEYCEKVLDSEPENAEAYLGKLMAELHVKTRDALKNQPQAFDDRNNYRKAMRFGDEKLKTELTGDIAFINDRNETARKEGIYQNAVNAMHRANDMPVYTAAAKLFRSIPGYRDADALAEQCVESAKECDYTIAVNAMNKAVDERTFKKASELFKTVPRYRDADALAEQCLDCAEAYRKNEIYAAAKNRMQGEKEDSYRAAIGGFKIIPGWKDADAQIAVCERRIEEIKAKEEADRIERERREEEARIAAKKRKITTAIVWSSIAACIAFVIVLTTVTIMQKKKQKMNQAMEFMNSGDYEAAYALFEEIGNKDAIASSKYDRATALLNSGDYDRALPLLQYAQGYNRDADSLLKECWDHVAVRNTIAAGSVHTVGLRSDGTVVAVGYNGDGRCDVSGWKNIVAVAAGERHTVGLRSDGTVVATKYTGNSDYNYGQCSVSGWKDIVAIAAGYYHTVGIRSDGTVVATGDNYFGRCNVSGWKDIVAIAAGYYHTVGLRSDGTVVATGSNSNGECNVSGWTDIVAIAAGWGHTVGLRSDGRVVAVGINYSGQCNVSGWRDIVAIAAGYSYTVGLRSDGTVVATGENDDGQCNVSGWTDIAAIAAGGYRTVGLRSDGTVVAVGDNNYGQCNVSGWKNIKLPEQK